VALFEEASAPPAGATPTSRATRRGGTLGQQIWPTRSGAPASTTGKRPKKSPRLLSAPRLRHPRPPWPPERLGIRTANGRAPRELFTRVVRGTNNSLYSISSACFDGGSWSSQYFGRSLGMLGFYPDLLLASHGYQHCQKITSSLDPSYSL
jgi:hypothetical protein